MSTEEVKEYSTTDFYITAMLLSQNFKLRHIKNEGDSKRIKRFFFEDSDKLNTSIIDYSNGSLTGNIRGFRQSIDIVKDLVHS